MAIQHDKLLGKEVLHNHTEKLDKSGGILTGDLEFPTTGFIMNCGSKRFYITIGCDGALTSTEIVSGGAGGGTPMGLLLALTYAS